MMENKILDFGYYNADCMKYLKDFPDNYFDLAICDPPYGINVTGRHKVKDGATPLVGGGGRPFGGCRMHGGDENGRPPLNKDDGRKQNIFVESKFYHPFDDSSAPDGEYFKELMRVSKNQIIWGGNFFLDHLGAASCIIVWDKKRRGMDQADCEIAWTSLKGQNRIFEFRWNGMLQGDMKHKETRIHPTQKPVRLYEWLLSTFAKDGDIILDTHVGSASSLIACHNTRHDFIGFEKDEYYYKTSKERYETETAQINIFDIMGGQQ